MTVTAERCSRHSTSRSGSNRNPKVYGEDEHGRAREASRRDREKVRSEARQAQGADPQPQELARTARGGAGAAADAAARCQCVAATHRCAITGRSRGVYRKFGLSRVKIREVASRGE